MARRVRLRWYHFLDFRGVSLSLLAIGIVLLLLLLDPLVKRDMELTGTVAGHCIEPVEYKDGSCMLAVQLSDGRRVSVLATRLPGGYPMGRQVELVQYRTWLLKRPTLHLKRIGAP